MDCMKCTIWLKRTQSRRERAQMSIRVKIDSGCGYHCPLMGSSANNERRVPRAGSESIHSFDLKGNTVPSQRIVITVGTKTLSMPRRTCTQALLAKAREFTRCCATDRMRHVRAHIEAASILFPAMQGLQHVLLQSS